MAVRTVSLGLVSVLLACSVPLLAQGGMGGGDMGGMGSGGMGGGGMQGGGGRPGGGGPPPGMDGPRPPRPPKPIKREQFDKLVTGMFRQADGNRDGTVTIDELRALFEARRGAIIRARFEKIDANHNGAIGLDEFSAWQMQMGSLASSDGAALGDRNGPVAEVIMPDVGDDPGEAGLAMLIEPLSVAVITQANANYDAGLSLDELLAYEGKRFDAADANHDGWLTMDELRPPRGRGPGPMGGPRPPCPAGQAC